MNYLADHDASNLSNTQLDSVMCVCVCVRAYIEHVSRVLLDRVIAAMQAGHQKHMFMSVSY